ncbi:hypothetical protein GCM10023260_13180 [Bartonella acomydis]|uniref:Uncharacterized protein n=1 Tax=Bartonella acomydis TaxID=686234 RepID=A0ABP9MUW8_9HYPH
MSAGRLQEIADILDVLISFFYADISTKAETTNPDDDERISSKAESLLLKNFRMLTRKKQRAILQLISYEKTATYFHNFVQTFCNKNLLEAYYKR